MKLGYLRLRKFNMYLNLKEITGLDYLNHFFLIIVIN